MEDPASEQALHELKVRLTKAAPPKSLIAQAQQRELREERRRLAAAHREPTIAPACDVAAAASAVPVVDSDRVAADRADPDRADPDRADPDRADVDHDPRELEPWFQGLPAAERERLRAHWSSERHRNDDVGSRARRRLWRAAGCGALLFFVLSLPQALLGGLAVVPALVVAGAIAGAVARLCGGGRFVYSAAGAIAFLAVMGTSVLDPLALSCLTLASYGMGLVGMDGEMRRSGGFEAK